jgi:Flp pilus assembly secretin CpaC
MYAPTSSIGNGPNNVSISRDPKNNPFGTTLDLVPTVSDDGSTIQLTLIPTITELVTTNQSGDFVPSAVTNTAANIAATSLGLLPLPHTRVRQMTIVGHSVKDGQTLVLGDFSGRKRSLSPFDQANPEVPGKNLLIFVTPTLVDPFGHPIHSADYYDTPRPRGGGFRGGGPQ